MIRLLVALIICASIRFLSCSRPSPVTHDTNTVKSLPWSDTPMSLPLSKRSILLPTLITVSIKSLPIFKSLSVASTWPFCTRTLGWDTSWTWTITSATMASSSVATNGSISLVGMSDMNPMVSTYSTFILDGDIPPCTVTSSVANRQSRGANPESCVSAFTSDVLPAFV